jgi:hypothetical protein
VGLAQSFAALTDWTDTSAYNALCRLDIKTLTTVRYWERFRFLIDYEHQQACHSINELYLKLIILDVALTRTKGHQSRIVLINPSINLKNQLLCEVVYPVLIMAYNLQLIMLTSLLIYIL